MGVLGHGPETKQFPKGEVFSTFSMATIEQ